jgi:protein-S-isoprenylcysteine O-methyltransferase Ste14
VQFQEEKMHTKDAIQFALTVSNGMEEQWMRSQFDEAYATYARHTLPLVPYLL